MTNREYVQYMGDVFGSVPANRKAQVLVDFVASVMVNSKDPAANWTALKSAVEEAILKPTSTVN